MGEAALLQPAVACVVSVWGAGWEGSGEKGCVAQSYLAIVSTRNRSVG